MTLLSIRGRAVPIEVRAAADAIVLAGLLDPQSVPQAV
jgi:hypothetical protein